MFLKTLNLYNWRKFATNDENTPAITIPFKKGLNLITGENDSGKTAIIDAVRIILGTNSKTTNWITEDDFSGENDTLKIECIFDDLSHREEVFFLEWLTLEGENLEKASLRLILMAKKYKDANGTEKIQKEITAGPLNFEQPVPYNVLEYLRATYLKPLRDAANELKPGQRSRLAKVIEGLDDFKGADSQKDIVEGFENAFNDLEKELKIPVLNRIDEHISAFLSESDYKSTALQKKSLSFSEILRRLELNFDDIKTGLGSTNILFMALELIALRSDSIGGQLTLIEEIEAHLHPQAQLRVIKAFEKYLNDNKDTGSQYIITTHSPTLASSVEIQNLILIYQNEAYSFMENYTQLDLADYKFLNRFLDATKANLFFAKGIILVEGYAENILIPSIAEAIGLPLHKYGISLVNVEGVHFERYISIFLRKHGHMNFPVSIISDLDLSPHTHYVKKAEESFEGFISINHPSTLQQIKEKSDFKGNNEDLKKHFEPWDYTEEQIDEIIEVVETEKKDLYKDGHEEIRVFFAKPWTLEHSIGKSILKEKLEEIILDLRDYKRASSYEDKLKEWRLIKNSHERATSTYNFILSNNLSKPIISQSLAEHISELSCERKKELLNDESLEYIINAIKHVTVGDSND